MTATATISAALLAFHADAGKLDLAKNRSGHNAEYLDLDKAVEQIRPLLAEHGLFHRHRTGWGDGIGWHASTIITHGPSGEVVESGSFPLVPMKQDAQGWGGALTYARRYTLVADNDDDGSGAPARRGRQARTPAASGKINGAQRAELNAEVRNARVPTTRVKEIIKDVAGVDVSTDIPADKLRAVIAAVKAENA